MKTVIVMEISQILYKLRASRELSQQNVADELGVDISTYSRYEKGKAELKISHAKKLADFYKLSLDEFYNYGEEEYQRKKGKQPQKEGDLVEQGIELYLKKKRKRSVSLTVELDGTSETVNHYLKLIQDLNKVVAASI